jgi:hypothetical protein
MKPSVYPAGSRQRLCGVFGPVQSAAIAAVGLLLVRPSAMAPQPKSKIKHANSLIHNVYSFASKNRGLGFFHGPPYAARGGLNSPQSPAVPEGVYSFIKKWLFYRL